MLLVQNTGCILKVSTNNSMYLLTTMCLIQVWITPFSPGIWYNHRKYCDKVLVKTSQRTSGGLYSMSDVIRSAEEYWVTGKHISAYPDANIAFPILSCRRIDIIWTDVCNPVLEWMSNGLGPLRMNTRSLERTHLPIINPILPFQLYPVGGKILHRNGNPILGCMMGSDSRSAFQY